MVVRPPTPPQERTVLCGGLPEVGPLALLPQIGEALSKNTLFSVFCRWETKGLGERREGVLESGGELGGQ